MILMFCDPITEPEAHVIYSETLICTLFTQNNINIVSDVCIHEIRNPPIETEH